MKKNNFIYMCSGRLIMSATAVSSLIFACRNVDKTKGGEIGRAPVAAAQGIKVANEVVRYNKAFSSGADAAISAFDNIAKQSKIVDYGMKGVKWAVNNVNPLICVSSGIKTLMAEDKTSTAIKEVAALSTMFAGEAVAKKALNNKELHKNILNKLTEKAPKLMAKVAPKLSGKVGTVIKGITFVGASIASYTVGEKLGDKLSKEVKANWAREPKINQLA